MLFAAATDHRYLDGGHTLDFVNKALEALDVAGWDHAETVLPSLAPQLAFAERMEEANSWRNPVDLVAVLEEAFEQLPGARSAGDGWRGRAELVHVVLNAEPVEILEALLAALREGASAVELASAVSFAASPDRALPTATSLATGTWPRTRSHSRTRVERYLRPPAVPELL
jgi:hypothetical protein